MSFVQIIDCQTNRLDDLNRLMDRWVEQTRGKRTATHSIVGRDRADSNHVVEIVEFPSYEDAMRNSQLPETDQTFREMTQLCEQPPRFIDLDVVRDQQLNKETARRFFVEVLSSGNVDALEAYVAEDYIDHDPANRTEVTSRDDLRRSLQEAREAFDLRYTVDDQVAEGDKVTTRWTMSGTHVGEFMGVEPTNTPVSCVGMSIFRFRDGKIAEGWTTWDTLGLMAQIGAVQL